MQNLDIFTTLGQTDRVLRRPFENRFNKISQRFGEVLVFVVDHVKFAGHGWVRERDGHQPAGINFLPGHLSGYQRNSDSLLDGPLDGAIAG